MLHDSLRYFIESNDKPSLRDENIPRENDENNSVSSITYTESDSDLLTNIIVNNFSSIKDVPSEETLLTYFQESPNQEHQSSISKEQFVDNLSDLFVNNDDVSMINWVMNVLDELKIPPASSDNLTFPDSDIIEDLNSILQSSFSFPGSVSDVGPFEIDVTHDSTEFSEICDSPSFNMFLKYVRDSPEHKNEFSKLEENLKYLEPEVESQTYRNHFQFYYTSLR